MVQEKRKRRHDLGQQKRVIPLSSINLLHLPTRTPYGILCDIQVWGKGYSDLANVWFIFHPTNAWILAMLGSTPYLLISCQRFRDEYSLLLLEKVTQLLEMNKTNLVNVAHFPRTIG